MKSPSRHSTYKTGISQQKLTFKTPTRASNPNFTNQKGATGVQEDPYDQFSPNERQVTGTLASDLELERIIIDVFQN